MRFHKVVPKNKVNFKDYDKNEKLLNKLDKEARDKGELLHRVIQESCADSYAIYQIIKVNKRTVRIEQVSIGGDDWVVPYWGHEATINRKYAEQSVQWRDKMAEIFRQK